MHRRFTHNWMLKLTSLVLAIGLWSHVRGQVNPWEIASFRTRLAVNAPAGFVLQSAESVPRTVTVMMRGPRLTLRQLKGGTPANPLASSDDAPLLTAPQVHASLDFSAPHRGEQKVPVKVETSLADVEMVGSKPSEITVSLDVAARKSIAVEPRFDLPAMWRVTRSVLSAPLVQVSGAARTLERVEKVRAVVEGKVSAPGAIEFERVPLEAVDENGEVVSDVEIRPGAIRVRATVIERLEEKSVPVKVRLRGEPASGYEAGAVEVEPSRVTIRGKRPALAAVESIAAVVDIGEARSDITRHVRPSTPAGTELVSKQRISVHVPIIASTPASEVPIPSTTPAAPAPFASPSTARLPQPAPRPDRP
jgi:YbbR domain-containing protein